MLQEETETKLNFCSTGLLYGSNEILKMKVFVIHNFLLISLRCFSGVICIMIFQLE